MPTEMESNPCCYTKLPKLRFNEDVPEHTSRELDFQELSASIEDITVAWCKLLRTLTGDDKPVFCFDNKPVRWHPATEVFENVNVTIENDDGCKQCAGLFIHEVVHPDEWTLSLRLASPRLKGLLVSSHFSTPSYLIEIEHQLKSILGEQSVSCQLSVLNERPSAIPGPVLLHDLFDEHCHKTNIALDFLKEDNTRTQLTYKQLNRLSGRLASKIGTTLRHHGRAGIKQAIVPVLLPQSPELYISWLAVLKTGAAVCPVNIDTPSERIKFIIDDVSAGVIVTSPQLAEKLEMARAGVVTIVASDSGDDDGKGLGKRLHDEYDTNSPAYVMYTSGSTGLPKGVVISHRAATQALLAHEQFVPPFARFLQFASPTFDVSVFEIFFPWYRGATLVGCERGRMLSDLPAVINSMQVDAAELTPTVAGELVRTRSRVPSLNVLLTIGEMLTRRVIEEFGASDQQQGILYGMYGPTEAAIHCTVAEHLQSGDPIGNIGVPFDTVSALITAIDDGGNAESQPPKLLPVGHIGELVLGGLQLAIGYLNREKETKTAFCEVPKYGRIYRTGDKARIHPNGLLECFGRIASDQVKLRGQRIELGEIEQTICKAQGVRGAVVNVVEGILVAFLTADSPSNDTAHIVETCQRWLPRYMIPGEFILLDSFPRLPSGKVDRRLLTSKHTQDRIAQRRGSACSEDPITWELLKCVQQVLGVSPRVDESLAAQGLDSLCAIKLSSVLRSKGIQVAVTDILDVDNIRGLRARLHTDKSPQRLNIATQDQYFEKVRTHVETELETIGCVSQIQDIHFCSPMQIAMLSETMRDTRAYFNRIEHVFANGIQESDVKAAVKAVIQHNEVLRSGFLSTDSSTHTFVQIIWKDLTEDQLQRKLAEQTDVRSKLLHPIAFKFSNDGGNVRAECQIHHSLYDGWSWELVCQDLSNVLAKKPLPYRPQFRTVVECLKNAMSSDVWCEAITYWRGHLQEYQPCLWPDFGAEVNATPGRQKLSRLLSIKVPEVKHLARSLRISMQTVFQSAFSYLLASYTGNADVVIGSVSSGRTLQLAGIENIIGPCVATVPLRVNIKANRTAQDLLLILNSLTRRSLKYEFVPLQVIKKNCELTADQKLFDGLFVWQDMLMEDVSHQPKLVTITETQDYLECAILIEVMTSDDAIQVIANFERSALPPDQAELLLCQLDHIVSLMADSPDTPLETLSNCLPRETLSISNFPHKGVSHPTDLMIGIKETATAHPDRVAIEFTEDINATTGEMQVRTLTYSELEISSNALAHHLLSLQVGAGHFVAVYMEKSPELYVSLYSIVKVGAAFVPITPSTPDARVKHILDECHCGIMLTTSDIAVRCAFSSTVTLVTVDKLSFFGLSSSAPLLAIAESMPAYAVFTSGSTGVPKGVVVTRRNLQSNLSALFKLYPIEPGSKLLQSCSPAFDVAIFEIFFTLNKGMTLCATTNDVLFRDIEKFIMRLDITHLSMTATVAAMVHPANVPKVKFLVSAGEPLTPRILQNWGNRGLWQGYGPCETTNIVTIKAHVQSTDRPNHLGLPLENTSVVLVSEAPQLVITPRGAVGELCIGGDQVAQGYLNMEELTAERFITHPEFGKMFRSGDLARMLPDGSLLFLGRHDSQVKIRGLRIELGEIDAVLSGQSEVMDSLTIASQGEDKHQQLVSFVLLAQGLQTSKSAQEATIQQLFDVLQAALPPYMVPSLVLPVESFPINSSGKKDQLLLAKYMKTLDHEVLDKCSRRSDSTYNDEPLSETEQVIASCVAQTACVPQEFIRKHTSFFTLGLDSVSAIALSTNLKLHGLGQIDVSKILRHSSAHQLARYLEGPPSPSPTCSHEERPRHLLPNEITEAIRTRAIAHSYKIVKVLPCTPLQESMLARIAESDVYHNTLTFELSCDVERLKEAWKEVIDRHDILRTRFISTFDARVAFVQVVLAAVEVPWRVEDYGDISTPELAQQRPLAVEDLVPYSFTLSMAATRTLLRIDIHHAIYDAVAMSFILKDVEAVYNRKTLSPAPPFESFLRYMVDSDTPECAEFWKSYLLRASLINVVPKQHSKIGQSFKKITATVPLPLDDLLRSCKEMSTTLLSVFQASWAKVLFHFSGIQDICFGNVYSGRNIPINGADHIVGPCFNTLPVRANVTGQLANLDFVHRLRDANYRVLPYSLTSLRRIRSLLNLDIGLLFDTLLLFQDDTWDLDNQVWTLKDEAGAMDIPLICEIVPEKRSGRITSILHFDEVLIPSTDANTLLTVFIAMLNHVVVYPSAQAADSTFLKDATLDFISFGRQAHYRQSPSSNEPVVGNSIEDLESKVNRICEVLSQLSKVDPSHITLDTTIFQLGLDSINALQLGARLKSMDLVLSASDILEMPSVREMANAASRSTDRERLTESAKFDFVDFATSQREVVLSTLSISEESVQHLSPCTPVQAGMLASFLNSSGDSYFNHLLLKLDISVNILALRQAWECLMDRYEMLRTGFFQTDRPDVPFGMITYASGQLHLPWSLVNHLPHDSKELSSLRKHLSNQALKNLSVPPWFLTVQNSSTGIVMQFSAHHALYDAQSMEIILSDFCSILKRNNLPQLMSIRPIQEILINEAISCSLNARAYWQEMQTHLRATKFPDTYPDHHRLPGTTATAGLTSQYSISRLQDLCSKANVSLQAACQAAWAKILAAYVGEDEVTSGVVMSGRNSHTEARDAAFPCLVTLPTYYDVRGTNQELLSHIMAQHARMTRYQFTPLAKIYEWTNTDSSLFNTLFVFQKPSPVFAKELPWTVVNEEAQVDYDISLEILPLATSLRFCLSFRSDLLPKRQAELILCQLDRLLINCLSSLDDDVGNMSKLPLDLLSVTPSRDSEIPPSCRLLHGLFEDSTGLYPSRPALESVSRVGALNMQVRKWTYTGMEKAANKFAHLLLGLGALPGDFVAICFNKCPEAYMAILGVLKAGCAYVALDPTSPRARQDFILQDSGARILLTTSDTGVGPHNSPSINVVVVDEPGILNNLPGERPRLSRAVRPEDVCYCLYTSGTTGTPKGCQITHNNAVQAMLSFQRLFKGHWDKSSRWLQFASFHFDVSVLEQYWSWSVGICLVSCPRDLLFEDLPGTLAKLEITHIDLTPSLARLIHPEEVPSLKKGVFITGGEALRQDILDEWGQYNVIYNGYGPTEVTIGCTMYPRVPAHGKPSNIGLQFDNVSSYVFRPGTHVPVLRGAIGELCVGGPLVGKGYLNRDDLTRERFIFLEQYNDRIYRTGDLVRLYHDDTFCFLGRQDDQVKLRGQRLEIGEINEAIRRSSKDIEGVATIVTKQARQMKDQLVSFLVITEHESSHNAVEVIFTSRARQTICDARRACMSALPGYMVPTHFISLNRLPLSANNKLDVKKLKTVYNSLSPEDLHKLSTTTFDGSEIVMEDLKKFVSLVADILGLEAEKIPPDSNLFQLGLDSITVTLFTRDLVNRGFPNASSAQVMKSPTIASLYKVLKETSQSHGEANNSLREINLRLHAFSHINHLAIAHDLGVSSSEIARTGPCSPLQEGIIYQHLQSQGKSYLANFVYELSGEVSIPHLKQAWAEAVQALPILRTKFVSTDNGFAQAVLKSGHMPVSEAKVSQDTDSRVLVPEIFAKWCAGQDHLSSPWEIVIIEGPSKSFMVLHIFHGIYDGTSLPFILDEVSKIYVDKDYMSRKPSLLDALPWILSLDVSGAKNFWQKHLEKQRTRPIAPSDTSNTGHSFVVSQQISGIASLEHLRRELYVTEQAIFLACWLCTVAQHFGFSPIMGIVMSGRAIDFEGAQEVIGPMFNTIPCAIVAARFTTLRDLVKACHEYYVATIPYQHTSLRDIRKWLKIPADTPLFDNLFVFQKSNDRGNGTEKLWDLVSSDSDQDFNLSFEVQRDESDSLTLTLATNDTIMDSNTSNGLCTSFTELLRAFLQNLDLPLDIAAPDEERVDEGATLTSSSEPRTSFGWTPLALKLREQIALLAEVDGSTIQEDLSIFQLGLDSIDVIRLSSRMRLSGVTLPVSAVMQGKTIANLVKSASPCTGEDSTSESPIDALSDRLWHSLNEELSCKLQHVESIIPATPLQEAMVAEMISSNFNRYYNHDVMSIAPWVDLDRLGNAWANVIRRNPILRTRFAELSDPELPFSYAQVVCSAEEQGSTTWVVKKVDEGVFDDELNLALRDIGPMDALSSPLVKLRVIIASAKKRYLVLSISHALYDGWSLSLMHNDVHTAYFDPSSSALLRPSYESLLGRIVSSSSEEAAEYWEGALRGYTPTAFPKQPHAESDGNIVHRQSRTISAISASQLTTFCKNQNISPQTLGIACWSLVLAGYLHKLDIVFGTVMLGRDTEDAEAMMFPLFNTVVIRSILHGSRSEFLKYIQEVLISMREFQHFPLRKAKAFANCASINLPLFDTLFIYQRGPKREQRDRNGGDEKELYKSIGGESDVEIPLCAEMEVVDEDVVWRVSCRDTLCGNDDVTVLFERVKNVLGEILNRPEVGVIVEDDGEISICGCPAFHESDIGSNDIGSGPFKPGQAPDREVSQVKWEPTPLETKIKDVLASVAGISADNISREHNLFHLGLDSISAIKVCSLLKKQSVFLAVSEILKAGTVPEMAKVARTMDDSCKEEDDALGEDEVEVTAEHKDFLEQYGLCEEEIEYVLPVTAGQTYMLATHESSNGELFYPYFVYKVTADKTGGSKDIDRNRLDAAWRVLTNKLPILRTVFIPNDKGPDDKLYLQVVIREVDNPVQWQEEDDLRKLASPLKHHAKQGYNAGELPVTLYATMQGNDRDSRDAEHGSTTMVLHIHHALYDAVSLPLMMQALAKLYSSTDPINVSVSPGVDLRNLVRYLRKQVLSEKREKFWKRYLHRESEAMNEHLKQCVTAGFDKLLQQQQQEQQQFYHRVENFRPSLLEDIGPTMQRARDQGVSIQAVFLACFAKVWQGVLFRADGKRRRLIVIGVYLSNRGYGLEGVARMIAPTLNIVPLRVDLGEGDEKCVMDVAKEVQEDLQLISSDENSCVSLVEVTRWTGVRIDVFVNFLKDVRDVVGKEEEEDERKGVINIPTEEFCTPSKRETGEGFTNDNTSKAITSKKGQQQQQQLVRTGISEIYGVGIDIEAAIRENYRFDVGIFGGREKLSESEGEQVLEGIQQGMQEAGGIVNQ